MSAKQTDEELVTELALIINTTPDLYFPYQSFVSIYLDLKNKPSIEKWFKEKSFQYNYLKLITAKSSGLPVSTDIFHFDCNSVPANPLFYQDIIRARLWMDPEYILNLPCKKELRDYLKAYYFGETNEETEALNTLFNIRNSVSDDTYYFITLEYLYSLEKQGENLDTLKSLFDQFDENYIHKQNKDYYAPSLYSLMANISHSTGNLDKQSEMINAGIKVAELYRLNSILYRLYLKKSELESGLGNLKESLALIEKSRKYYKSIQDYRNVISVMFTECLLYYDNGMYSMANDVMEKVEPLCLEHKKSSYAFLCGIMSLIKYELGDFELAEEYALKALEYVKTFPNFNYESQAYASLINIYIKQKAFDKAEKIARARYAMSKEAGNVQAGKIFLYKLVDIYIAKKDYCQALPFALEADSLDKNVFDSIILYYQIYEIYTKGDCSSLLPNLLSIYLRFPYIRKAKNLTSEVDIDEFYSVKEKYEFLRRKDTLRDDYADALEELAITVIWNMLCIFIFLFILIWSVQYFIKKRQNLIGAYRIKKILGEGGMGVVYLGHSIDSNIPVAVKILKESMQWSQLDIKRFKRESEILQKLNHTNIVNYVCSGEHGKKLYLAMEYVKGKTLKEILNEHWPLPVNFALQVIEQVLKALIYLHEQNIIHRDIKPSNIIIKTASSGSISMHKDIYEVKIMDFGLARSSDHSLLTQSAKMIGTPVYLAPEAISRGDTNKQTDVYSFGVLLYEMFAGVPPYHHQDTIALLYQVLHSEPRKIHDVLENIPECIENLIETCIAKDPELRFKSFNDVMAQFKICKTILNQKSNKN